MPITKQEDWDKWVANNSDSYGKACVDVAREVMRLLDEWIGPFVAGELITKADHNIQAGGITGFMAGCVAQMVSHCHSHGEEFRRSWNRETQIGDEGDKANESGGVLNPTILHIG